MVPGITYIDLECDPRRSFDIVAQCIPKISSEDDSSLYEIVLRFFFTVHNCVFGADAKDASISHPQSIV